MDLMKFVLSFGEAQVVEEIKVSTFFTFWLLSKAGECHTVARPRTNRQANRLSTLTGLTYICPSALALYLLALREARSSQTEACQANKDYKTRSYHLEIPNRFYLEVNHRKFNMHESRGHNCECIAFTVSRLSLENSGIDHKNNVVHYTAGIRTQSAARNSYRAHSSSTPLIRAAFTWQATGKDPAAIIMPFTYNKPATGKDPVAVRQTGRCLNSYHSNILMPPLE
ncbi:hypothetical protein ACFE04_023909 [Oxalis oulophora]